MDAADERVRIAMRAGVDSLNVATAAAIALHACRRRLGWPGGAAS
jgi:tRNA G18 (ribose-2'-O)-methylase SpoU